MKDFSYYPSEFELFLAICSDYFAKKKNFSMIGKIFNGKEVWPAIVRSYWQRYRRNNCTLGQFMSDINYVKVNRKKIKNNRIKSKFLVDNDAPLTEASIDEEIRKRGGEQLKLSFGY